MAVARSRKIKPATTSEAREKQLVSLAMDVAEKQMREGTASAQVITHYLKLGSTREKAEMERMAFETRLLEAKEAEAASRKKSEEMYEQALQAMRKYSGHKDHESEEYFE